MLKVKIFQIIGIVHQFSVKIDRFYSCGGFFMVLARSSRAASRELYLLSTMAATSSDISLFISFSFASCSGKTLPYFLPLSRSQKSSHQTPFSFSFASSFGKMLPHFFPLYWSHKSSHQAPFGHPFDI